jgi:hypothetical protein
MLSVVVLNVVMLSVIMLSVVMLNVVRLNAVMLSVIMLSVVMLIVDMLIVDMLIAVILSDVSPGVLNSNASLNCTLLVWCQVRQTRSHVTTGDTLDDDAFFLSLFKNSKKV